MQWSKGKNKIGRLCPDLLEEQCSSHLNTLSTNVLWGSPEINNHLIFLSVWWQKLMFHKCLISSDCMAWVDVGRTSILSVYIEKAAHTTCTVPFLPPLQLVHKTMVHNDQCGATSITQHNALIRGQENVPASDKHKTDQGFQCLGLTLPFQWESN